MRKYDVPRSFHDLACHFGGNAMGDTFGLQNLTGLLGDYIVKLNIHKITNAVNEKSKS